MSSANKNWNNIFIGFAIVTILSGIYLVYKKDYVIGISGSLVGLMILLQNVKAIKDQK